MLVCEGKEIPRGSLGLVLSQYMEKVPVRVFHSGSPDCHRDPDEGGFQKNWSLIHRGASFFFLMKHQAVVKMLDIVSSHLRSSLFLLLME